MADKREQYWVPDDGEAWALATQSGGELPSGCCKFSYVNAKKFVSIVKSKVFPVPNFFIDDNIPEDLTLATDINTPTLLHAIKRRFDKGEIYTSCGSVMVTMNPYQANLDLYGAEIIEKYRNPYEPGLNAHIYLTPSRAYQGLMTSRRNQAIIVSGESNSGKTEAIKHCLNFLTQVSKDPTNHDQSRLTEQILASNTIIEAFGNAKTVHNNNATRYLKLNELLYNDNFHICGAVVSAFCLDKWRVVQPNDENSRNFHIFYMLLRGMTRDSLALLNLRSNTCNDYTFAKLKDGGHGQPEDLDDKNQFDILMEAFAKVGFSEDEVDSILNIISAILNLGNIKYIEQSFADICSISEHDESVANISKSLGLPKELLERGLLSKSVETSSIRRSISVVNFSLQRAMEYRDNIVKFLYEKLFLYLIRRINHFVNKHFHESHKNSNLDTGSLDTNVALSNETQTYFHFNNSMNAQKIALLDMFGFEILAENSYEQFLINYSNELLHQQFNEVFFLNEKLLYEQECVPLDASLINCKDNKVISDFEQLFKSMESELKAPKFTSQTWFEKVKKLPRMTQVSLLSMRQMLIVKHFNSGNIVTYSPFSFMEKTSDTTGLSGQPSGLGFIDIPTILSQATNTVMMELFPSPRMKDGGADSSDATSPAVESTSSAQSSSSATTPQSPSRFKNNVFMNNNNSTSNTSSGLSTSGKLGNNTTSNQTKANLWHFQVQLNYLLDHLKQFESNYVKCIKSNEKSKSFTCEIKTLNRQLSNYAIFDLLPIQLHSLNVKIKHDLFITSHKCLLPSGSRYTVKAIEPFMEALYSAISVDRSQAKIKIGRTMVFMNSTEQSRLANIRHKLVNNAAITVQKFWRMQLRKQLFVKMKIAKNNFDKFVNTYDVENAEKHLADIHNVIEAYMTFDRFPVFAYLKMKCEAAFNLLLEQDSLLNGMQENLKVRSYDALCSCREFYYRSFDIGLDQNDLIVQNKELVINFESALSYCDKISKDIERMEAKALIDVDTITVDMEASTISDGVSNSSDDATNVVYNSNNNSLLQYVTIHNLANKIEFNVNNYYINSLTHSELSNAKFIVEMFCDLLPNGSQVLQRICYQMDCAEGERTTIFEPLLSSFERGSICIDHLTGGIAPRNIVEYVSEPTLVSFMRAIDHMEFVSFDTYALYFDCLYFLKIRDDYSLRPECVSTMINFIQTLKPFSDHFRSQLAVFGKWAENTLSRTSLKKALKNGIVPDYYDEAWDDIEVRSSVSVSDTVPVEATTATESVQSELKPSLYHPVVQVQALNELLRDLKQVETPSKQMLTAIEVASLISDLRTLFIKRDWEQFTKAVSRTKALATSNLVFHDFEECQDELYNCEKHMFSQEILRDLRSFMKEQCMLKLRLSMDAQQLSQLMLINETDNAANNNNATFDNTTSSIIINLMHVNINTRDVEQMRELLQEAKNFEQNINHNLDGRAVQIAVTTTSTGISSNNNNSNNSAVRTSNCPHITNIIPYFDALLVLRLALIERDCDTAIKVIQEFQAYHENFQLNRFDWKDNLLDEVNAAHRIVQRYLLEKEVDEMFNRFDSTEGNNSENKNIKKREKFYSVDTTTTSQLNINKSILKSEIDSIQKLISKCDRLIRVERNNESIFPNHTPRTLTTSSSNVGSSSSGSCSDSQTPAKAELPKPKPMATPTFNIADIAGAAALKRSANSDKSVENSTEKQMEKFKINFDALKNEAESNKNAFFAQLNDKISALKSVNMGRKILMKLFEFEEFVHAKFAIDMSLPPGPRPPVESSSTATPIPPKAPASEASSRMELLSSIMSRKNSTPNKAASSTTSESTNNNSSINKPSSMKVIILGEDNSREKFVVSNKDLHLAMESLKPILKSTLAHSSLNEELYIILQEMQANYFTYEYLGMMSKSMVQSNYSLAKQTTFTVDKELLRNNAMKLENTVKTMLSELRIVPLHLANLRLFTEVMIELHRMLSENNWKDVVSCLRRLDKVNSKLGRFHRVIINDIKLIYYEFLRRNSLASLKNELENIELSVSDSIFIETSLLNTSKLEKSLELVRKTLTYDMYFKLESSPSVEASAEGSTPNPEYKTINTSIPATVSDASSSSTSGNNNLSNNIVVATTTAFDSTSVTPGTSKEKKADVEATAKHEWDISDIFLAINDHQFVYSIRDLPLAQALTHVTAAPPATVAPDVTSIELMVTNVHFIADAAVQELIKLAENVLVLLRRLRDNEAYHVSLGDIESISRDYVRLQLDYARIDEILGYVKLRQFVKLLYSEISNYEGKVSSMKLFESVSHFVTKMKQLSKENEIWINSAKFYCKLLAAMSDSTHWILMIDIASHMEEIVERDLVPIVYTTNSGASSRNNSITGGTISRSNSNTDLTNANETKQISTALASAIPISSLPASMQAKATAVAAANCNQRIAKENREFEILFIEKLRKKYHEAYEVALDIRKRHEQDIVEHPSHQRYFESDDEDDYDGNGVAADQLIEISDTELARINLRREHLLAEDKMNPFGIAALRASGRSDEDIVKTKSIDVKYFWAYEIPPKTLKANNYSAKRCYVAGYTLVQLYQSGFSLRALRESIEAKASQLRLCGATPLQLSAAGYSEADIMAAGYPVAVLREFRFSAAHLRHQGNFNLKQLVGGGFDALELRMAGFNAGELRGAGLNDVSKLRSAGFDLFRLKSAGFTIPELKRANFTFEEMKAVGYHLEMLHEAGFAADVEREVLAILFKTLRGREWSCNYNWLSSKPVSEWFGVTVSREAVKTGETEYFPVVSIDLHDNKLRGELPREINVLKHLQSLVLYLNDLQGTVPEDILGMRNLTNLDVSNNPRLVDPSITIGGDSIVGNIGVAGQDTSYMSSPMVPGTPMGPLTNTKTSLNMLDLTMSPASRTMPSGMFSTSTKSKLLGSRTTGLNSTAMTASQYRREMFATPKNESKVPWSSTLRGPSTPMVSTARTQAPMSARSGQSTSPRPSSPDRAMASPNLGFNSSNTTLNQSGWVNTSMMTSASAAEEVIQGERQALMDIFHATQGRSWKNNRGWGTSQPVSTWFGIKVNSSGRVKELILSSNSLNGTLPDTVGVLECLEILDLRMNQLKGPISSTLGNCGNLTQLNLQGNNFCGTIPKKLGRCLKLKVIDLRSNQLSAPLPDASIRKLKGLQYLGLQSNMLMLSENEKKSLREEMTWCRQMVF